MVLSSPENDETPHPAEPRLPVTPLPRLKPIRRALGLVWASAPGWTAAGTALMVVQGLLPLAALYFTKLAVDAVAAGVRAPGDPDALRRVLGWIALTGLVTLLAAGLRAFSEIVSEQQSQRVTDHVMDVIHRQSVAVDLAYYEDPRFLDTLYRAQQEAPYRPTRVVQALSRFVQASLSLTGIAVLLVFLHWIVAVVLVAAVVPGLILKMRHSGRLNAWQTRRTSDERRGWDLHRMLTDGGYAKEVRLFGIGDLLSGRYREVRARLREERLHLARARATGSLAAQVAAVASLFGVLAFIAWETLRGLLSLGDMVMYFQAFQRAQGYLQDILGGLASLYEDSLFLGRFEDFLAIEPAIAAPPRTTPVPRPVREGISLEGVTFRYPSAERDVLRGVTFSIRPGEIVALVGDNGSGKTTLAKLLCRLHDPTGGRISVDGIDLRNFDPIALRREISAVFQDHVRWPFTASDNVRVGDVQLSHGDPRIRTAAEKGGVAALFDQLPRGWDTILGARFEDGTDLSGGEWQQVALARAFLRDAQLVVLDEPTSALSARAEAEVFGVIRRLLGGRGALLISHRFSTVRMADRICVLDGGQIVEQGTHTELMALGGRYAALHAMQARADA